MTQPEKEKRLSIDEQIRLLEQGDAYLHNSSPQPQEPNNTSKSDEPEPGIVIVSSPDDPFLAQAGTTPGRGNPYGPTGRISPRTASGNDANPLPGEPMPPQTDVTRQQKWPIRTVEKRSRD